MVKKKKIEGRRRGKGLEIMRVFFQQQQPDTYLHFNTDSDPETLIYTSKTTTIITKDLKKNFIKIFQFPLRRVSRLAVKGGKGRKKQGLERIFGWIWR